MGCYSTEDIMRLLKVIADAELEVPPAMLEASNEELCKICNGVGADWLSDRSRKIITKALKYTEATSAIHDFEYTAQTRPREKVDELWLVNGLREVRYNFPQWWNWKRWLGERAVLAGYEILRRTGKVAWALSFYEQKKGNI